MIALAASRKAFGVAPCTSPSITPVNCVALSGSPITPVEARKTSAVLHPVAFAARAAVKRAASRPDFPVKALALPELTTSARALPPFTFARHHSTGADGHLERVKTPATVVPGASSAIRTSVRSLYLIPAAAVASRTPAIAGMSGTFLGARGEIFAGVLAMARLLMRHGPPCHLAACRHATGGGTGGVIISSARPASRRRWPGSFPPSPRRAAW